MHPNWRSRELTGSRGPESYHPQIGLQCGDSSSKASPFKALQPSPPDPVIGSKCEFTGNYNTM